MIYLFIAHIFAEAGLLLQFAVGQQTPPPQRRRRWREGQGEGQLATDKQAPPPPPTEEQEAAEPETSHSAAPRHQRPKHMQRGTRTVFT